MRLEMDWNGDRKLHVAIIMDGNGRWAANHGLPRWRGHLAGVESVRSVVRAAPELGVGVLTLYAFSSDNWKRPSSEVNRLFELFQRYCRKERDELVNTGVRVTAIGRRDRLPPAALDALHNIEDATRHGTTLLLRLALDYSSKHAITEVVRSLATQVAAGQLAVDTLEPEHVQSCLTRGVPEPDLLIRTAGEQRLSDFLLWELAYAELSFTPVTWPAFRGSHLATAVAEYHTRERRFGGLSPDTADSQPDRLAG